MLRVENVVNIPVFVVDKTGAVNSIVGTGLVWLVGLVRRQPDWLHVRHLLDRRAGEEGRTHRRRKHRVPPQLRDDPGFLDHPVRSAVRSGVVVRPYSLGWCPIGSADYRTAGGTYVTGHCYVTGANATTVRVRILQPGGSTPNLATFAGNYPSGLGAG